MISRSQTSLWMFSSIVREALEKSVTCAVRPVRFQISQESMLPMQRLSRSICRRTSGTLSMSHLIFVAEK